MSTATLANRPNNGEIQKTGTVKSLFEAARSRIEEVAPKHLSPDRLMRVALMTISRTPKLGECTPHSLLNSFMTATQLGLEVGGVLGEAYLVPYGKEATFILGYRGMINLARRSGQIISIEAQVVREGDLFEFEYGLEIKFRHHPKADLDCPITHVWALARFRDGGHQLDVMTIRDIEAIRKRSRSGNNGPWVTDFAEMAKKTVVRRLCKYLPLSPEMADAVDHSDRNEFGDLVEGSVVNRSGEPKRPFGPPQVEKHPTDDSLTLDTSTAQTTTGDASESEELDVSGADSEPPTEIAILTFEAFIKLAEDIAKDCKVSPEVFDAVVPMLKLSNGGPRQKDAKVRGEVIEAMRAGQFDWKCGKVVS